MYIKRMMYDNVGPINNIDIRLPFNENGNPKPIIFVGENGTGKSLLLSNIVDSLYESARQAYNNAAATDNGGYQYFKGIHGNQIQIDKKYLCVYISFEHDNVNLDYIFKSGEKAFEDYKSEKSLVLEDNFNWEENNNFKFVTKNIKLFENVFDKNAVCYFGPERYEKPSWMGDKYLLTSSNEHINLQKKIKGKLDKPINVSNILEVNLQWLLDIIVDSRADILKKEDGSLHIINVDVNELLLLSKARKNVERIMSEILDKEVYFSLNWRNTLDSRFKIIQKNNNKVVVPTLDSLSTGQLALFNLFTTIIRYADYSDINKSINISEIEGIVAIDEIELHLHSKLQIDVLPKLIKLFPKVQFIITSHSPLFLLGMKDVFGEDEFELYQMPDGRKINVEMFSEFKNAYNYYTQTQKYNDEITEAIKNKNSKALIVTEGATDWRHMLSAYNKYKDSTEYKDIFIGLDFEFLQYEPKNSTKICDVKLEMGCDALREMCESFSKIKQDRKIIFIADRDNDRINKALSDDNKLYKQWGNNVYSFILPVPDNRKETPNICIEHFYSEEEIKTEKIIDDIHRRLYLGYEFDNNGIGINIDRFCCNRNCCGENKINIIEGTEKEKVIGLIRDRDINFALSKMEFAESILNNEDGFNDFNRYNFIEVFKIINDILESD